jgi:hypothetical protein
MPVWLEGEISCGSGHCNANEVCVADESEECFADPSDAGICPSLRPRSRLPQAQDLLRQRSDCLLLTVQRSRVRGSQVPSMHLPGRQCGQLRVAAHRLSPLLDGDEEGARQRPTPSEPGPCTPWYRAPTQKLLGVHGTGSGPGEDGGEPLIPPLRPAPDTCIPHWARTHWSRCLPRQEYLKWFPSTPPPHSSFAHSSPTKNRSSSNSS